MSNTGNFPTNLNSNDEELFYAIALSMYKEFSDNQKFSQLQFYTSALKVYQHRNKKLSDWPLQEAAAELKFIDKHHIQCFSILDKCYPNRLANIKDPPNLLYLKGSDHFNMPQLISIVGTRQHTYQVKKIIHELIEGLKHLKMGVISGLALGVDGIAHETAMEHKIPTWGVLAHGLDTIYPNQHRRLAINMLQNGGGLLTECIQKTPSMTFQFPKRNRIVAGMSDITIVIESEVKGGSMITAQLARGYDREVFAVPGKIHDHKSKGCLWLIKNNIANMYHDPIHLLENMNWPLKEISPIQNELVATQLDPTAQHIYLLIQSQGPINRDALLDQLNITSSQLAGHLLALELNGRIHLQVGNNYICI
jgi:DNA processing protein